MVVKTKKRANLFWITTLSAAEEIPTAVITYVALLMFLQFGNSMVMSAFYSACLFLPFALRSFVRSKVRSAGNFKQNIHIAECCMFILLILMVLTIKYVHNNLWLLFVLMFLVACFCAWHDLLGRMYYDRMLYPRQQKIYNKTKIFAAQTTIILTYGVLIMFVGFLEVVFRMPTEIQTKRLAWAMECYIIAGVFLVLFFLNIYLLKNPSIGNTYRYQSMATTVQNEIRILERIRQKQYSIQIIVALFFLLLPQALMFFTRVFFLLARAEDGGLDCSIPDVGFAQGTIGVIAFGIGLFAGRQLLGKYGAEKMFWWMVVPLTLSPTLYMLMSQNPYVGNMFAVCVMCFFAQLFFGYGLNICTVFIRFISGERYRNSIGYLYIPSIAGVMIIPMSLSGLLCATLGFQLFFIVDAAFAIVAWILLLILSIKTKLLDSLNS